MNKRVDALIEEARKLTPEEREELFARLQVEFDDDGEADGTPEEIEAAWSEELQRRISKRERGETTGAPAAEVHARIRERLRRP